MITTTSNVAPVTGSQWLTIVTTPRAAVRAVSASSTGRPAATSAPNTSSSRISVIGTEVASALPKFSELLIAWSMLASPVSAMRRSGCRACTPATACWSAVAAWSRSGTVPGTWNVTRALCPSLDTSDCPPPDSGVLMPVAYCGSAASAAATWDVACRMAGSVAKVAPGALAWISTVSVDAWNCAGATLFSTRSAWPDWPGSYCGRFLVPSAWPAIKSAATRSSQPNTAVFRCLVLHPATRSVRLGCSRSPPGGGSCVSKLGVVRDTGVRGWRIGLPPVRRSRCCWCELAAAWSPPVSWTLVGGDSQLATVRDDFVFVSEPLQRSGMAQHLLRFPQRVFLRAEQPAGDGRVQPGGRDQDVVEEQEQDSADGSGKQRLRQ